MNRFQIRKWLPTGDNTPSEVSDSTLLNRSPNRVESIGCWRIARALGTALLLPFLFCGNTPASDHADPLVLNPLKPPKLNQPRLSDLHVFLDSDQSGGEPRALVLSLCAFPSLPPLSEKGEMADTEIDLEDYLYTIHLDLNSQIQFVADPKKSREFATVLHPSDIAPEVTLSFELENDLTLKPPVIEGIDPGKIVVHSDAEFDPAAINIATGIFDDPFIFPRFFRKNVIGIVVSIPLDRFPDGKRKFLVWATTSKNGKQIDHVGRAQRTQLPRFENLNTLPPGQHAADILRRHTDPTLVEDITRSFLSPLFGHRPYDATPDVVIFDASRPVKFPNGRHLHDDVAPILARMGDAQLLEASFTDDPSYPRATKNDKDFLPDFPYLAPPWTVAEVKENPLPFHLGVPTLVNGSWRLLWLGAMLAIIIVTAALLYFLRSKSLRILTLLVAIGLLWWIWPVFAVNLPHGDVSADAMMQPRLKIFRLITGGIVIALLSVAAIFVFGWRKGSESLSKKEHQIPGGEQGISLDDRQYTGSTYDGLHKEVIQKAYYKTWGGPDEKPLPTYALTFSSLVKGIFRGGRRFHFGQAVNRTLLSDADMRWGPDGKGFQRLLHPNGMCLSGTWEIDSNPDGTDYTGFFAAGSKAPIIARYSTCCTETRGGHWRSLSLVGKIYLPESEKSETLDNRPANFFTQEDIGGTRTESVREAELANSPPVSPWRRGKGIFSFLVTAITLAKGDKMPSERQLYEIAELGKPEDQPTSCPRFMKLTLGDDARRIEGFELDFRSEILDMIYDRGDSDSKRPLVFQIEVSDEGERHGRLVQRVKDQEWTKIGRIVFDEASVSHNGDFVIHFHHPPWREDRNDPASTEREKLRNN